MSEIGRPLNRVDAVDKVCGRATFAAEFDVPNLAYGALVTSSVAAGQIIRMDTERAASMPGVLLVMTPFNTPSVPDARRAASPPAVRVLSLLQDDSIAYCGQPVGVVVADSFERAVAAAAAVRVVTATGQPALDFEQGRSSAYPPKKANREETDSARGDAPGALVGAAHRIEQVYTTPPEYHNPMEPHASVAVWSGDQLTVYDSTQNVAGTRDALAKLLQLDPSQVAVISPFVGGGFGCKGSTWSHVVLAAMAAKRVARPVKVVLDRTQMFASIGNRPRTEQRVALGATGAGRLESMQHHVLAETSFLEDWIEPSALVTRMAYACPNVATTHRLVRLNISTPTFTRAPGEASGSFALECAMDELAHELAIDPVELRLQNYAERDPATGRPFSSKAQRDCYQVAAERFQWSRRRAKPGALTQGRWLVGLGMASATYPTNRSPASARATLFPDGTALVQSGTQELGTGSYTVLTQVAADALGYPVDRVRFELGDSRLPRAPGSGGSQSAASVAPAVHDACVAARDQLIALALADPLSPAAGRARDRVSVIGGRIEEIGGGRSETVAELLARHGANPIVADVHVDLEPERNQYAMHAFGAVFAEVWVDAHLGIARVHRMTGAYGVGTVLNAKTARSQLLGGMVWGASMALFENGQRDSRSGRIVNSSLSEYHVPVNADIGAIDVIFLPESDPHVNPLGIKGIGEIGITGVAAAIGNAVFNATGRRIRDLPITPDKLLSTRAV